MAEPDVLIVLHQIEIDRLVYEPSVLEYLRRQGEKAAAASRSRAPKETGAGAASIHAELRTELGPEVRVSWTKEHYYMYFHQRGTVTMNALPFMTFGQTLIERGV